MVTYESLGIRPMINADATLTRLGGSLMPPEVLQAMNNAAGCYIDLHELQQKVGARIAELTHNEAAYVCTGAAAGLTLATAACVIGANRELLPRIPHLDGLKNEVIVHKEHRNGYDYAVQQAGVKFVEIGSAAGTTADDLRNAITDKTAAFFWFQGAMTGHGDLPLPEVIAIASEYNVPVVVDAAAQLPPVENLWRYTEMGASLAIFSGGKDLCGPQASGLILGKRDLIEAIRLVHGNPHQAIGRPMKVGKEEMMGLLAAVERYLKLDHSIRDRYFETTVKLWCDSLNPIDGINARRDFPNEAGQPLPRCLITVDAAQCGMSRDQIVHDLLEGSPRITVAIHEQYADQFYLNPWPLSEGQEHIVLGRLLEILRAS